MGTEAHTPEAGMTQPGGSYGRLTALGNELVAVHIWLREELARLRGEVDSYLDGAGERPRELRAHCVAFCSALQNHHTSEDGGAFRVLADGFPELAPVIAELERDHGIVSGILGRLAELVEHLGADAADPQQVRSELDGLAALLESHFVYEEKKLVTALNALDGTTGTAEELFGSSVRSRGPSAQGPLDA